MFSVYLLFYFLDKILNLDEVDSVDKDDTNKENNAKGNELNQDYMDVLTHVCYEFGCS